MPVMEKLCLANPEEGKEQLKIKNSSGKRMMLDYLRFESVK